MIDYKNERIVQIIPAPKGILAWYEEDGANGSKEVCACPIVCLALVEDKSGIRYVVPMEISIDGEIDEIEFFKRISVRPDPPGWKKLPKEWEDMLNDQP